MIIFVPSFSHGLIVYIRALLSMFMDFLLACCKSQMTWHWYTKYSIVSRSTEWVMREMFVCTDYDNIVVRAVRPLGIVLLQYVGSRKVET